ncbi:hypothetical protein O7600_07755 [Micromonospora sp. WMMA1998]|uniref:hypothetical protein n=1 Tax=Micromonospora sp. WMMA1998 TaxID=3015167 RepID=UPI00248B0956|nr:hypothetical protein [Micromonospora sp. WMMA1998]WBC16725.1 hypothetical protein O7600_07755 [Micromonospora sp. WMMA1998]
MTGSSGGAGALVVAAESGLLGALEATAPLVRCAIEALGTGAGVVVTATVTGGVAEGADDATRASPGSHPALAPARTTITISAATCGRRRTAGARPAAPRGTGGLL